MSPVNPQDLRSADRHQPVAPGTLCPKCQYELGGLPRGGKCPECGTPIRAARRAGVQPRDNLTDAPDEYLQMFRVAVLALAVLGLLSGACQLVGALSSPRLLPWVMLFTGAGWAIAVALATRHRPFIEGMRTDPTRELLRVRWAARLTQLAWPLQGALYIAMFQARDAGSPLAETFRIGGKVAPVVGMAGFLPLCVWLANLADWAQNTDLAARLRVAGVLGGIGAVVFLVTVVPAMALSGTTAGAVLTLFTLAALFAYEAGIIIFVIALLQLAHMALWAVTNARAASERDRRVMERKARRAFTGQATPGSVLADLATERGENSLDPCARCGYDLTGLRPGDPCPECGNESPEQDRMRIVSRSAPAPLDLDDIPLAGDEPDDSQSPQA